MQIMRIYETNKKQCIEKRTKEINQREEIGFGTV